ncbi:hypothetical protein RIF29_15900 [Crotalaria pallida]|uniref:Uncharacterized protein n=1 Tax=Crotalaria pallida TaxID=3830 RepID=A0AAN9FHX2_CROPI
MKSKSNFDDMTLFGMAQSVRFDCKTGNWTSMLKLYLLLDGVVEPITTIKKPERSNRDTERKRARTLTSREPLLSFHLSRNRTHSP